MNNDEKRSNKLKMPRMRRWLLWIAVFAGILLLMLFRGGWESQDEVMPQYQFERLLDDGQIAHATIVYGAQNQALTEVVGAYRKNQNDDTNLVTFRTRIRLTYDLERHLLRLPYVNAREANTTLMSVLWSILPIILIATFIWFFFIRQITKAAKGSKDSPSLQERIDKEVEQQQRFDKVLDRWEQQADRMDKILDRGERQEGVPNEPRT